MAEAPKPQTTNYLKLNPNKILDNGAETPAATIIFERVKKTLDILSNNKGFNAAKQGQEAGYDHCYNVLKETHKNAQVDLGKQHTEHLSNFKGDDAAKKTLEAKQQQEKEALTKAMNIAQQQILHAYNAGWNIKLRTQVQFLLEGEEKIRPVWNQFVNTADRDALSVNDAERFRTARAAYFYENIFSQTKKKDYGFYAVTGSKFTTNPDGSSTASATIEFTPEMGVAERIAISTAYFERLATIKDPNNPDKPAITTFDLSKILETKTYSSLSFNGLQATGKQVALGVAQNILGQYPEAKFKGLYNSDPAFQKVKFAALEHYIKSQANTGFAISNNFEEIINAMEPYINFDVKGKKTIAPEDAFKNLKDINKMSLKEFLQHCANYKFLDNNPGTALDPQKVQAIIQAKSQHLYAQACHKKGIQPHYRETKSFDAFQAPGVKKSSAELKGMGNPMLKAAAQNQNNQQAVETDADKSNHHRPGR